MGRPSLSLNKIFTCSDDRHSSRIRSAEKEVWSSWSFNITNHLILLPICSMYGIFTNICPKNLPNVHKYTIHGAYGLRGHENITLYHVVSWIFFIILWYSMPIPLPPINRDSFHAGRRSKLHMMASGGASIQLMLLIPRQQKKSIFRKEFGIPSASQLFLGAWSSPRLWGASCEIHSLDFQSWNASSCF